MPGGVEVDLVDPVAEAVVGAQPRRVLVRLEAPADRPRRAGEGADLAHPVLGPLAALAAQRLDQDLGRPRTCCSPPAASPGWRPRGWRRWRRRSSGDIAGSFPVTERMQKSRSDRRSRDSGSRARSAVRPGRRAPPRDRASMRRSRSKARGAEWRRVAATSTAKLASRERKSTARRPTVGSTRLGGSAPRMSAEPRGAPVARARSAARAFSRAAPSRGARAAPARGDASNGLAAAASGA